MIRAVPSRSVSSASVPLTCTWPSIENPGGTSVSNQPPGVTRSALLTARPRSMPATRVPCSGGVSATCATFPVTLSWVLSLWPNWPMIFCTCSAPSFSRSVAANSHGPGSIVGACPSQGLSSASDGARACTVKWVSGGSWGLPNEPGPDEPFRAIHRPSLLAVTTVSCSIAGLATVPERAMLARIPPSGDRSRSSQRRKYLAESSSPDAIRLRFGSGLPWLVIAPLASKK